MFLFCFVFFNFAYWFIYLIATRSRIPRVKETPVKGNGSPRGNLISPDVVYSRSGRKIKKIQYSENVPDSASPKVKLRKSSLRHQHSLKKDNGSKTEFITPCQYIF